ncbi:MAG: hypothetical protein ACYC1T_02775 [Sulfuricaulis sp.]
MRKPRNKKLDCGVGREPSLGRNTDTAHPTDYKSRPQQVIVMPFLHQPPERLQPRITEFDILMRYSEFTIDRDVVSQLVGLGGIKSLLLRNYEIVFAVWTDSAKCAYLFAPAMRCEIGAAALEVGYFMSRAMLEEFYARAH